jgi:hypothetical protein
VGEAIERLRNMIKTAFVTYGTDIAGMGCFLGLATILVV